MSASGQKATGMPAKCPLLLRLCCKTRLLSAMKLGREFRQFPCPFSRLRELRYHRSAPTPNSMLPGHAAANGGGARQSSLTSRRRFWAVAVSRTSSLTPLKPRNRSRSSLRMRFICANRISTFLRSRRDCSKACVLASARTRSRTSSSRSRVTLRTAAVVHFGFNEQAEQSFLLAR